MDFLITMVIKPNTLQYFMYVNITNVADIPHVLYKKNRNFQIDHPIAFDNRKATVNVVMKMKD